MTPNVLVSKEQIIGAAEAFGQTQPKPISAYIYRELYDQYSGEELSGAQEQGVSVRFSLMPSKFTPELGQVPVQSSERSYTTQRQPTPSRYPCPSVLDAISYWQSLRASSITVSGDGTNYKTGIRHIDLEPARIGGDLVVPRSAVDGFGKPDLYRSLAEVDYVARVLVG
ncbi:unnamed protein product [Sphagnum jensenii]|uniref:Uncharacterized protein n=1 Tax=Sphagnum jensenii TaxID=128206 RepID=A0ABP0VBS5_9BRYO